uniref:Uncharacterized protein n=1 Tax=Amphiprion ocellaris TaxID=80972 RepID=A0AAQ5X246_AMPOC
MTKSSVTTNDPWPAGADVSCINYIGFVVKINRKKFDVLSRKSKHDVGLSVVSRSKAITKRKETCLKEYKQKNQYDTKMAPEDKILQRFTMERQQTHEKKDKLNEEDEQPAAHLHEVDSTSTLCKFGAASRLSSNV